MGSSTSITSSPQYDSSKDPCNKFMVDYLACVESHAKGLTEGDDCSLEGDLYKKCRINNKTQTPS